MHLLVRSEDNPQTFLCPVTESPHGTWTLTYADGSERILILCPYEEVRKLMRRGIMVFMHRLEKPLEFPYNLYAVRDADCSGQRALRYIHNEVMSYSFLLSGAYGREHLVSIRNGDMRYYYKGLRRYERTSCVEDSSSVSFFRGRRGHERCVQINSAERSDFFKGSPERLWKSVDHNSTAWFKGTAGHEIMYKRKFHKGNLFKYAPKKPPVCKRNFEEHEALCVVCMDMPRSFAMVPCGHLCLCESCKTTNSWTRCPLCRETVENILHVYV